MEIKPAVRFTPNLFGIAFGFAGLAQVWTIAAAQGVARKAVADVFWVLDAAVWLTVTVLYLRDVVRGGRLRTELADPVFAPFVALLVIVPMPIGVALAGHARTAGIVVFVVFWILTVILGGWLSGQWILQELSLAQWHPGYFLPTVAGGLIASIGCGALGWKSPAVAMFGWGVVCWLVLGSIVLLRLFTQPALPAPLRPTMAIEMAPPAVAGLAWFGLNGGKVDGVALGLAGYAVLMALVQVRLIQAYKDVPFGPGFWAFSFSYAAAVALGMRWLAVRPLAGHDLWIWLLVAVVTAGIALLAARTTRAMMAGAFLPRVIK